MDIMIATGAVSVGVADVHLLPDDTSELVTQALLNVPVICGEVRDEWVFVTLSDYEGWMRTIDLDEPAVKGFTKIGETCATPLALVAVIHATHTPLYSNAETQEICDTAYLSTVLPLLDTTHPTYLQVALPGERAAWIARSSALVQRQEEPYPRATLDQVVRHAQHFLGVPYLWGGTSWQGIDCSALVQLCYRMVGYTLPRNADRQHAALSFSVTRETLQTGDLIFFGNPTITHVGIALNKREFIHADGRDYLRVTLNSFDPVAPHYSTRVKDEIIEMKRVIL